YVLSFATFRSEHAWSRGLVVRLRLVGELLANTLMRQRAAAVSRHLEYELAHAARVAMMGELTASIAHELNHPLAAILSNVQAALRFLAMQFPDLAEVREALIDIVADDQRATAIIQQLRSLGQKGALERTALDINALVQQVIQLVRSDALERQVQLDLDLGVDLPVVYGDRIQLQQVMLNLVLNAFEAMRQTTTRTRVLRISTTYQAATITVAFRDTGVGVDEPTLQHMFKAFFTTKAEGMGMGLAISHA